jgi:hypothetical protein
MLAILADRILKFALVKGIISPEQKGFCPVSGCVDHTGLFLNVIENFHQHHHELYLVFIDYFNAYGSVDHAKLVEIMSALGISDTITNFIKNTLLDSLYVVHTGYGPTEPIILEVRLKQGNPSSPVLFLLFIELLLRMLKSTVMGFTSSIPLIPILLTSLLLLSVATC